MKKILNLLFILCCAFVLTGCGNNETIEKSKTIVLEVDTNVVPTFTSNFGSGSYDIITKKYTHTIDYVKDLYISLSYEDLKTVTVHIPTKDMDEDIITKQVEFGQTLDAEVKVTVEGVKSLEGITFDQGIQYSNLEIGKKNTFKFTLPSREQNYNLKFTLPNYRPFELEITSDDLVSGSAEFNTPAITTSQVYVGFEGNQYQYKIYSLSTNEMVASGSNYIDSGKIQYVLLNNDDGYYVKVDNVEGQIVYKMEQGEDKIIKIHSNNNSMYHYIALYENNNNFDDNKYIYNKQTNSIVYGSGFYGSIENIGLIIQKNGNLLYLADIASKATPSEEYDYEYIYHINEDDFISVNFDITRINRYTNEVIENNDDYYFSGTHQATFENNTFNITIYEVQSGYLTIELKDKGGNVIKKEEDINISSYFQGMVYSGRLTTQDGKIVPYQFPIFYEEMTMENCDGHSCYYTYPAQIIDTSISYTMIRIVTRNGYIESIGSNSSSYIIDNEQELIMGINVDDTLYFELEEGKEYTLYYNGVRPYMFTATKEIIDSGNVIVYEEGASVVKVKVDPGVKVTYEQINFIADEQGIVKIPKSEYDTFISLYLSNSYVSGVNCVTQIDGRDIYEVHLYALVKGAFYTSDVLGSNHIHYTSAFLENDGNQNILTNLRVIENDTFVRYLEISTNKFEYNDEYEAYVYSVESDYDHVLVLDNISFNSLTIYNAVLDEENNICYVYDDINIIYNGQTYTLEEYSSYKYLRVSYDYSGGSTKISITPITE